MQQEDKIQCRCARYVSAHIRPANCRFGNVELQNYYRLGQVASWAEVAVALGSAVCVGQVEVHLFLRVSCVSADTWQCHFGKEGIRPCGFDKG